MSSILRENYKYRIWRFEKEEKVFYSAGISRKLQDGKIERGYLPIQFKKGVNIENGATIVIKKEFETFYKTGQETRLYHFITDYELVNEEPKPDVDPELPF